MVNLDKIYNKVVLESKKIHLKHLFEDGEMTFDDIRNIFKDIFKGKVYITTKVKAIPFALTYKDGNFALSDGNDNLKDPITAEQFCRSCRCDKAQKDALLTAIGNIIDKLSKNDFAKLNSIFANGQNYMNFDVVVPTQMQKSFCKDDYFVQNNNLACYDSTFSRLSEDEESSQRMHEMLECEIGQTIADQNIQRIKSSYSPDKALNEMLQQLEHIVDGVGYKAKVNDYVAEQLSKLIVNIALKHGIDLYRNSDFVNELISRTSYVSSRKPTKGDLFAYAKRDGVDIKNPEFKSLIEYFDQNADQINQQILKPIETLAVNACILLVKCFVGMVAADPSSSAQKLLRDIDSVMSVLQKDEEELTPEKILALRKSIKKLDNYQKSLPEDGILFMHNGKVCRICGDFGKIDTIMKLINY